MLELNPKGCTKGTGVLRLCELLGIKRENVYCVGDNENDISMLEVSALPFAPANAIPGVKAVEGVHLLLPCQEPILQCGIGTVFIFDPYVKTPCNQFFSHNSLFFLDHHHKIPILFFPEGLDGNNRGKIF